MAADDTPVSIPVSWIGIDEMPIFFANQFLVQHQANEFTLIIGQLAPPAVAGTPAEQAEQLREIAYVPIRPLARIAMTRGRMSELIAALQANLDNHDRMMEGQDPR